MDENTRHVINENDQRDAQFFWLIFSNETILYMVRKIIYFFATCRGEIN